MRPNPNPPFSHEDYMAHAAALSLRGLGATAPNPNVGCILVQQGHIVARGWTQKSGRPHAEAMALEQAGAAARGACAYVTLEPCAHESTRGGACAQALREAGVKTIVYALQDPDPRTHGRGAALLRAAGCDVLSGVGAAQAQAAMAGWLMRMAHGRPRISLKLAVSLDGCIALASGESQWITGAAARAHTHLLRAQSDMILVGGNTYRMDAPRLNVRLSGLEQNSPRRAIFSRGQVPENWEGFACVEDVCALPINDILLEGGAAAAAAFLGADAVDRIILYRAPIIIGGGRPCIADIGLGDLAQAHGRWQLQEIRRMGADMCEIYERKRLCSLA
jgi:diaminohydroxyphosphoribosylaminopyrimidine deaminase / 5-amino-6-(5-phosphoribosylamino)uracil reductase